ALGEARCGARRTGAQMGAAQPAARLSYAARRSAAHLTSHRSALSLKLHCEPFGPGESRIGIAARLVLCADAARIAPRLDRFEYGGVGDLALVGLGAGRNGRDLDVTDERKIALEFAGDIALSGADVIDVEHQANIGTSELGNDPRRLADGRV